MDQSETVVVHAKVLLQVDLEGHSAWLRAARSKPEAVSERITLAKRLHASLAQFNFDLVSWKGDGGVYAASEDAGAGNFDFSIAAAEAATQVFANWRAENKESRSVLRLRLSIHYAPKVYVHSDPGYWTSDDLNVFIKYEREIGVSGTIAITEGIFPDLSPEIQSRFIAMRELSMGALPGVDLIRLVRYLPIETEIEFNKTNRLGFFEWLNDLSPRLGLADEVKLGPRAALRATVGNAVFLFSAPHPESPLTIDLSKVDQDVEPSLKPEEAQEWKRIQENIIENSRRGGKEDGPKVSAIRVTRPLSDSPYAQIEWHTEKWSRSRGFHMLLEKTPDLWSRLASNAADVQESGLQFPGILCCHFIVRTAESRTAPPSILLCQRQQKGQDDTYSEGSWSLSFEEQLIPGESVTSCAKRGLAEELLGQEGSAGVSSRVIAASSTWH
jgi:hypothetical protein